MNLLINSSVFSLIIGYDIADQYFFLNLTLYF